MPDLGRGRASRHTVAVLVTDGVSPFEMSVAVEVFGIERPEIAAPWYRFHVCGAASGPLRAKGGFSIVADHDLDDLARADTVIVPNWPVHGEGPPHALDALRRASERGARVMSFCSGAFALAEAGLLDGRPATTHWFYAAELAARFPSVDVRPQVLYVDDGDVLTSAGTAAGIDLCLHVVRCDHGAEIANAVARRMVVPPHRDGGQAQYIDAPVPGCCEGDALSGVLEWMESNLDQPLTVAELADRAHLSSRSFARHFRAATGTTPHQWLLRQRVLLAQRLLERDDDPIERVAERSGFGTAANLRQHFVRAVGTSPQAYRRTFRAAAS